MPFFPSGCCKALHFSGHGTKSGLCFEDGQCRLHNITAKDLKELLEADRDNYSLLQFVFLSSCYSQAIGQVFINAGAHYCICVKKDVEVKKSVYNINSVDNSNLYLLTILFSLYNVDTRCRFDRFHASFLPCFLLR